MGRGEKDREGSSEDAGPAVVGSGSIIFGASGLLLSSNSTILGACFR